MPICVGKPVLVPAHGHVHRIVVHRRSCRRRVQTNQFLVDCHKPKEGMTLPIRVTWTAPMPTSAGMKRKTIYVLADGDRIIRYLGSTDLPCEERFKLHKLQASSDACTPFNLCASDGCSEVALCALAECECVALFFNCCTGRYISTSIQPHLNLSFVSDDQKVPARVSLILISPTRWCRPQSSCRMQPLCRT
jgi:hypothetical protein